jgi:hypothetical protein
MADLLGDATGFLAQPQQPDEGLWRRALGWLYGNPQSQPGLSAADLYQAMGKPMPPSGAEAAHSLYGMTGIPDIQAGAEAFQRGEYPQALGQAGAGVANLASLAIPALRAGATVARAPLLSEALGPVLADTGGALRIGGRPPRGAITLDTPLSAAPDLPPGELIPGIGNNRPPPPPAKFPQYAESYPDIGPPEMKIDPKSGAEYLGKKLTPEAEDFSAERDRIIKDMRVSGYEPYYDPAQRFHVDPTNYPPNVDTTAIAPAKQATIDRHMEAIGSEGARARLQAAYQRGTEIPNTADWYALGQLEQDFIKELGPVAGRKAFQENVATGMAATTGGANPTTNWLMAAYGNYLRNQDLPYPQAAYDMPFPIGGRYATTNTQQHQSIFDAGGFSALGAGNPKRHNFAQNFAGNRGAATMDEQMVSGMTPGRTVPPDNTYGLYEKVLGEEAAKVGVQPQNFQDVAWAGFKNLKDPKYTSGKPMIEEINDSIERTHRLTGMSRDEIVRRGIIGGQLPLYGLLGAVGAGAAADQYGR